MGTPAASTFSPSQIKQIMATDRGETRAGVEPSVECGVVHRAMRGEETETVEMETLALDALRERPLRACLYPALAGRGLARACPSAADAFLHAGYR
jgi:hypothetical protein